MKEYKITVHGNTKISKTLWMVVPNLKLRKKKKNFYLGYQLIYRNFKPITIEKPGVSKVKTSFEKRGKKNS